MKKVNALLFPVLFISVIAACTKAGTGGDNTLVAFPFHHTKPIPNTIIYIKYNTNVFPGSDPGAYDDNKISTSGASPQAMFTGLKKGKYFLYGVGFDSSLGLPVRGGIPIKIAKSSGETDIDVPITE